MSWLVLLPLASILGYVAALVRRNLIGWSIAPISVLSSIVLILFLSDFLSLLRPVSLCLTLAGVGLLFAECVRYVKHHGFSVEQGLISGIGSVGLVTALLIDYNQNVQFVSWDMFSHWGTIIKLVGFTNSALDLKSQGYKLLFEDYPPGTTYLAYYFLRFTGFKENIAVFSHAFLLMLTALPAIAATNLSYRIHAFFLAILTFIVVHLMGQGWSSILIDQIVGALFGAVLSIYWINRNNPKAWASLPPILGFLVLAKGSGGSFVVASIAMILIVHWLKKRESKSVIFKTRSIWKILLLCAIVPLIISQLWSSHVKTQHLNRSLAGISIATMAKQATHCCTTEREQSILAAFSNRMLGVDNDTADNEFSFQQLFETVTKTHWDAPVKLTVVMLFIGLIVSVMQAGSIDRRTYGFLITGIAAGGLLYCCLLLLFYLYGFSDYEGRVLTSLERYFGSYALGMAFLLLAGIATIPMDTKTQKIAGIALLLALIIPSSVLGRGSIRPYLWTGGPQYFPTRDEIVPLTHPFVDRTYPRVSVLVVWQADKPSYVGLEYFILRYELAPRTTQPGGCSSFGPPIYDGDKETCNWSEEQFVRELGSYHYVFVGSGLQSLQKAYPSVFDTKLSGNSAVLSVLQLPDGKAKLKLWE